MSSCLWMQIPDGPLQACLRVLQLLLRISTCCCSNACHLYYRSRLIPIYIKSADRIRAPTDRSMSIAHEMRPGPHCSSYKPLQTHKSGEFESAMQAPLCHAGTAMPCSHHAMRCIYEAPLLPLKAYAVASNQSTDTDSYAVPCWNSDTLQSAPPLTMPPPGSHATHSALSLP